MKIGFLGNTNNYPFIIAKQMKDLGCEVVLFVDAPAEDMLNRPEHYTTDIKYPYPDWIKENVRLRNPLYIHFPQIFLRSVLREINTCNAVVLNDYGHRFRNFIDPSIPSLSLFSGGDLEIMAEYENVISMKFSSRKLRFVPGFIKNWYAHFSVNQLRKGISGASLISYFPKGLIPNGEEILNQIFHNRQIPRFNHLHVITEPFPYVAPRENPVFRIFSFTRFMWKTPFPAGRGKYENKGNDIMIRGIAQFISNTGLPLEIHFVEKGLHVEETKQLIDELGFTDQVTWHQEMPFIELKEHIINSDVVIEQLGNHFISGGFYSMLIGRPLIGNARPDIFDSFLEDKSPVCHATTPEEVCEWLIKLNNDKKLLIEIGQKSRAYVLKHFDIKNESVYFKEFFQELIKHKQTH